MEQKAPYYATLAYDADHAKDLKKLCRDLGIKQKDFVPLAVNYFKKTGIDPQDPPEEIINDFHQIVKRSENRLIGFIKTQDKNALQQFNILSNKISEKNDSNDSTELFEAMTQLNQNMSKVADITKHILEKIN